ncbi:MAG: sensor histidine kinase [Porphyromonadaceae bacterium]|nr:MAG: sensor histidine kinase [Porphyromonadaceae bacterium]
MKLLNKTSLIILTITLFIFFLGGITFYKIIQTMIIKRVDRELISQKNDIVDQLNAMHMVDNAYPVTVGKFLIKPADSGLQIRESFKDTVLYDQREKLYSPYRLLEFTTVVMEKNFKVSVFRSMFDAENLIEKIVLTMMLMLLAFILALFFLNRYFFRKIWDDFFFTVNKAKKYNLRDDPNLDLPYSEVEEFQILNQVFEKLTERIHKDYNNLKEFTENASHEIQTPLSVMHSKIELLLQHGNYSEEQISQITKLGDAVNRLSSINKVLILLTRIENNQFPELSTVHLKERIEYHLGNFKELIEARNISVECTLNSDIEITVNTGLADILIINLIKNAIRHNFDNGKLKINLGNSTLEIINTGPKHDIPADQLFNRFVRTQNTGDSLGLGLSLVKKICELYDFDVRYFNTDELHTVTVSFSH